ncbi:trypsin-like serine protease [Streptomyces sp. AP-93]|uniref:S1 family peptidase n=1 Tax=Streptomyces sp. AP-93 TaxID=2929048 RepID=UPI001FAEB541|nr:serine protease [Streptomyces sp. AP-93]MCJ0873906.1 serine protease [Streptomyces sp. AP-93]
MNSSSLLKALGATAAATVLTLVGSTAASAGSSPAPVSPYIVGGGQASEDYAFMASLHANGGFHCGASLVSPDVAVTAAHCVEGAVEYAVRVGSAHRSSGGETSTVGEVLVHPEYDFAVLRLTEPVQAQPITIADEAPAGTPTRLLGWGQVTPERGADEGSESLKELDTTLVDSGCTSISPQGELCVDSPLDENGDPQGACYGDSGGPAIVRVADQWQLIGATSRGGNDSLTCAEAPSIYTDVTALRDFVESALNN